MCFGRARAKAWGAGAGREDVVLRCGRPLAGTSWRAAIASKKKQRRSPCLNAAGRVRKTQLISEKHISKKQRSSLHGDYPSVISARMTATASRARAACPRRRWHGYEDRSSGKKLRWSRLQNPGDKAAKNDWDSMVGINGIQWDSMGFNGIHDVSTEFGLQAACANFIGPANGILIFMRETRIRRRL